MANEVYTIGHSTHAIERFLELLQKCAVNVVADVRSAPFSRHNPQYNRDNLQNALRDVGIKYVFLGRELGARSDDEACYVGNKVQYDRLAETSIFRSGIERVLEGAESYHIALMCAERDPLQCHRTILVSRVLVQHGITVRHILANGTIESHVDALARLSQELGIPTDDFFRSQEEHDAICYSMQAEKIAYERGVNHADPDRR